jgi:hypothetical protein
MAKPCHTAYQVMADFSKAQHENDFLVTSDEPVALDVSCIEGSGGRLKNTRRFGKANRSIYFSYPSEGYVSFGYDNAMRLLEEVRKQAKFDFKKGARPSFYLRKLTMSEFMVHPEFKKYAHSNVTVQKVFKRYMLLHELSQAGFQA